MPLQTGLVEQTGSVAMRAFRFPETADSVTEDDSGNDRYCNKLFLHCDSNVLPLYLHLDCDVQRFENEPTISRSIASTGELLSIDNWRRLG